MAFVAEIIFGIPLLTKFSELGTTGPPYSPMSAEKSELASDAKSSQESSSVDPYH